MKNEQQQNQNGKQAQSVNHDPPNQAQDNGKAGATSNGKQASQTQHKDKSNSSADNEGRIGKAHERWPVDDKQQHKEAHKDDQRTKSDKTVTTPDIDAPIYDPEKTEKKIPKM